MKEIIDFESSLQRKEFIGNCVSGPLGTILIFCVAMSSLLSLSLCG